MAIYYIDLVNGNDSADGSTFALGGLPTVGPWKTITSGATGARIAAGDVIRISKTPDPVSTGINATWTYQSRTVTLSSAVTQTIDNCETAWTPLTNVTAGTSSSIVKQGTNSISLTVASAFTTGKAAYRNIGSTLNLSTYEGIAFWMYTTSNIAANSLQIQLCSDTTGDTPVESFTISTAISTSNNAGRWVPIIFNKGSALSSSVQSIRLTILIDLGASTVTTYFDNFIAVKATGNSAYLDFNSLISKQSAAQGGTDGWYHIASIDGTTVTLEKNQQAAVSSTKGYAGDTDGSPVALYSRTAFFDSYAGSSNPVHTIQDSGTVTNYIEYQGGYDISSVVQNGETIFDGRIGNGYGLYSTSKNYYRTNRLSFTRFYYGIYVSSGKSVDLQNILALSHNNRGLMFETAVGCKADIRNASLNAWNAVYMTAGSLNSITIDRADSCTDTSTSYGAIQPSLANTILAGQVAANGCYGVKFDGAENVIKITGSVKNNGQPGFSMVGGNYVIGATTSSNATAAVTGSGDSYFRKCTFGEATEFQATGIYRYFSQDHDNVAGAHLITTNRGVIASEATVRHTASGIAWRINPQTYGDTDSNSPLTLPIAKIAVAASASVTVKAWARRSNTGLSLGIQCRKWQLAGIDSDAIATMTAAADTWEEITITFTPTEAGVVVIEMLAYSPGQTTYNGYIDDLTINQA